MTHRIWCIFCYSPATGEYLRFSSRYEEQIKFWFNWCQKYEPEFTPELRLCELTPVEVEQHGKA